LLKRGYSRNMVWVFFLYVRVIRVVDVAVLIWVLEIFLELNCGMGVDISSNIVWRLVKKFFTVSLVWFSCILRLIEVRMKVMRHVEVGEG
jgi:hypothetical protein